MTSFPLKMAWRDSRRNRNRLLLFISSIIIGIAALTAIRSFSENLLRDIDRESKTLLGADLLIEGNQPTADSVLQLFKVPKSELSTVTNFLSMVRFTGNGGTRLSLIRGIEGNYPFYGKWKTAPENAWRSFRGGQKALVDHALMLQYNLQVGDSVQIGNIVFEIEGDMISSPGRSGVASNIAPVVFISAQYLQATGLIQMGSRVDYQYFFSHPEGTDVDALVEKHKPILESQKLDAETVEDRKRNIESVLGNFNTFLNLTGFISLLLGSIGVAGAVSVYIKDKLPIVAILRCLGASGRQAYLVFLYQIVMFGFLGAIIGVFLGNIIQKVLPYATKDLLPIENISTNLSLDATIFGLLLGVIIAALFALLPLAGILKTSPLRTLRTSTDDAEEKVSHTVRYGTLALITATVIAFTRWLAKGWQETGLFVVGIAVAFGLLYGTAQLYKWLLRKFFPSQWSYTARQSIANLYRPNNQTNLLIITIGLGTMLLSLLYLLQGGLLKQIEFTGTGTQPNMIIFGIQSNQKDSVVALVSQSNMPVQQVVPIVTMRISEINGITKDMNEKADTAAAFANWLYNREFRCTFRDSLIESETLMDGKWISEYAGTGLVPVSISDRMVGGRKIGIGTKLTFNVQGTPIEAIVESVRKVDFTRMQTNFLVLFPKNVLETAPQFHVVVTKVADAKQSASFQSELVKDYPNVSAIDLTQILESAEAILKKVSFIIQFMAFFSMITGILVLFSTIYQSKHARVKESVLLRTIGASRRQIISINALEYFYLGALASLAGILLAVGATWALCVFVFKIKFFINWLPMIVLFVGVSLLTILIGVFSSLDVVKKSPLEVLRAEI